MPASSPHRARAAAGLLLASLGATGCVERLIREAVCGDGVLSRGEVCLALGERSQLTIEGLTGLTLRAADFDGDGHADLLVLGTDADGRVTSRLWRGRGDGAFIGPSDPGVGGCSAYAVAGDADGDGPRDLLVDACGPSMSLFAGDASGRFGPPVEVVTGIETRSSGLVDLDRDGQREVVVFGSDPAGDYGIAVAERDRSGAFAPPVLSRLGPPRGDFEPTSMAILDVDDDARFDAVLVQPGRAGGLSLAPGDAGLGFGPPRPVGPPALVIDTSLVRDLDEDQRPDVLAVSFEQQALIFLRAEGADLVERARTRVPGLRVGPASAGDIDADDHLDLLLFEPGTRRVQAWFGQGDGRFDGPAEVGFDAPVGQLALVDVDEDGALDIVVGTFEAGTVQIWRSDP